MSKYERLARLMKIMTLIRAQRNLHRRDLATKCEVSIRTIQRDLDTLCYAGVPVFWADDGYEIMPDYFMPPMNLSLEEALHLIIATKAFSKDKEQDHQKTIESAISKIIARLPEEMRYRLEELMDNHNMDSENLGALQNAPPS